MTSPDPHPIQGVIVGGTALGGGTEVPADVCDKDFWKLVLRYQFCYSMVGLFSGLLCVVGGSLMILNGVIGNGSWSADILGMHLKDAAPGVVLFVVGIALAQVTRFTVRIVRDPTHQPPPVVK